jgi:cytochrome c-type biogenesis protein
VEFGLWITTFIEGVITFTSPCLLPMIPIYIFYLTGSLAGNDVKESRTLVTNSLGFIIGFTIIFTIMGVSATLIGTILKENSAILRKISAIIMIVFGLNFTGILSLSFLNFEESIHFEFNKLSFFSSILFGTVFALSWTPCVGPILSIVLMFAASLDKVLKGGILLLVYSLGLALPFFLTALLFEKSKMLINVLKKNQKIVNIVSGIILILGGILILTGKIQGLINI